MKRTPTPLLLLGLLLLSAFGPRAHAQGLGSLVVFAEQGEAIQVRVNGQIINDKPAPQVRMANLPEGLHKGVVTVYTDGVNAVTINQGFGIQAGHETYYNIKLNKKNVYDCKLANVVPLGSQPTNLAGYDPNYNYQVVAPPPGGGVAITTTDPNANVNISMPGVGIQTGTSGANVNINVPGMSINTSVPGGVVTAPAPGAVVTPGTAYVTGYSGVIGCPMPMSNAEFNNLYQQVNLTSEYSRAPMLSQIMINRCATAEQVKAFGALLPLYSDRVAFLKFAFDHTYDLGNYYIMSAILPNNSDAQEIANYATQRGAYGPGTVQVAPQPGFSNPPPAGFASAVPGYTGPVGCQNLISATEYNQMLNNVKSQSFDDTQLKVAKQIITGRCLTVQQVKGLAETFNFEQSRLDFAKFAYAYTHDKGNYFQVNEVFDFDSSVEELSDYTAGR